VDATEDAEWKVMDGPMIIAGAGHGLAAILNVRTMHRLDQ
jgi:hypothetical protein